MPPKIHLLDVGHEEYGDAILCEFEKTTILIDGAHKDDRDGSPGHESIPAQLASLLQHPPPFPVSLVVVTHAHSDHIGCLPRLVDKDKPILQADFALVADPKLGWGRQDGDVPQPVDPTDRVGLLAAALREEIRTDLRSPAAFDRFLATVALLEPEYNQMLDTLAADGTKVVRFGRDDPEALLKAFSGIGLKIIGPSQAHLELCAKIIPQLRRELTRDLRNFLELQPALSAFEAYQQLTRVTGDELRALERHSAAVNLQSLLMSFEVEGHKFLFTGDMQFNKPGVDSTELKDSVKRLRTLVQNRAPYGLVKIAHHGAENAFSAEILDELGSDTLNFGICTGESSEEHPSPSVLKVLEDNTDRIKWARTDRNGLTSYTFPDDEVPVIIPAKGKLNDSTPPNVEDVQ